MLGESFRFIHAGDFHLEKPLGDLDALPPALRDAMADAPRRAAAAALHAAAVDNVDFLVLSGDLLQPQVAGAHGMALLLDHFEELHAKKTPIFWAAGQSDDPTRWPDSVPLPPNVTLFNKDSVTEVAVQRAGRTIAVVAGKSCDGRNTLHVPSYRTEPTDDYKVAVGYGQASADALADARYNYWALGGKAKHSVINDDDSFAAIYCGTPQARSLSETGRHGYVVIDVDADRTTRPHLVESDVFRYASVQINASEINAVGGIRNAIGERIVRLQHDAGGRHVIVSFDVNVASGETLQSIGDVEDLTQWARREFGHSNPSAWVTRVNVQSPERFPSSWTEEDTILGDFLRAASAYDGESAGEINLLPYTEETPELAESTTALLSQLPDRNSREVLGEAAMLGVELLRGGKPAWKA